VVAGYLSNSLALLSDAGHNFADALALGLSWYAVRVARRPADERRTYGYHRVGILTALANAVALLAIAVFIFVEAAQRFRTPEPVHSGVMVGVAIVAVLLNALISVWLHGEAQHDLNIRSAYLHMIGDAVSAVGVAAAGMIVWLTGQTVADPAVSVLIGLFILWSTWGVLRESVNVLLEGVPAGLDMKALEAALSQVPGVLNVHDLHVWAVYSGITACSGHVVVAEQSVRNGQQVIKAAAEMMQERFHISHTTIQVEVEGCGPNEMYCALRGTGADRAGQEHRGGH
jgi:cobalt-zinc-cadmium efflux system protein